VLSSARIVEAFTAGRNAVAPRTDAPAAVDARPPIDLTPRSPRELRALLATILRGAFHDVRFEFYVRNGAGELAPVHGRAEATDGGSLLAELRARLLRERHDFTDPYVFPAIDGAHGSIVSAPLLDAAYELAGLVVVERRPGGPTFTHRDLALLEGTVSLLSFALQRSAVIPDGAEQRRARDLADASRIQRGLMSGDLPADAGVEAIVEYHPAYGVGGDFYALKAVAPRVVGVAIGDVSGNGVSAALVMSRVASELERRLAAGERPAEALAEVNGSLYGLCQDMYATACCARIDLDRRTLTLSNAGHLPVLVGRAGGEVLACGHASGTPLGMLPCTYAEEEVRFDVGDTALLVTDGLVEALDHPDGRSGIPTLLELLRASRGDPRSVDARVRAALREARSAHPLDDVTWVVLRATG